MYWLMYACGWVGRLNELETSLDWLEYSGDFYSVERVLIDVKVL